MRAFADPVLEAERQRAVLDREIVGFRRDLDNLGRTEAVSAEHAVRRAELAQRLRVNLDWLLGKRSEMAGEVGQ